MCSWTAPTRGRGRSTSPRRSGRRRPRDHRVRQAEESAGAVGDPPGVERGGGALRNGKSPMANVKSGWGMGEWGNGRVGEWESFVSGSCREVLGMTAVTREPKTLADVVARLGGVPLERIPARPAPGTATEADV